ncbi:MAG: hypothetical protein QM808_00410 [Steroidobacteraceae bacterium]
MPPAMKRLLLFWGEVLRNPRRVGSLVPSGQALGGAVANTVMETTPGYVVEIGAGTGAITGALAKISHHFAAFSIVEKSPRMAGMLARRFPQAQIIAGCASLLRQTSFPNDLPLTLVSSLPFRSLPRFEHEEITRMIEQLGRHEGGFRFIQYSYLRGEPFQINTPGLQWRRRKMIIANVPPATIWILQRNHR